MPRRSPLPQDASSSASVIDAEDEGDPGLLEDHRGHVVAQRSGRRVLLLCRVDPTSDVQFDRPEGLLVGVVSSWSRRSRLYLDTVLRGRVSNFVNHRRSQFLILEYLWKSNPRRTTRRGSGHGIDGIHPRWLRTIESISPVASPLVPGFLAVEVDGGRSIRTG
jgi:hypothetical protein